MTRGAWSQRLFSSRVTAVLLAALMASRIPLGIAADTAEETRARLAELEQRIESIRTAQARRTRQQGQLQEELRERELELSSISRKLEEAQKAQVRTENLIQGLREKQTTLADSASEQQEAVAAEIRAAYKSGGNDQLKLLLSENDPQDLARVLAYYRYILGARTALLEEYEETLESLQITRAELERQEAAFEAQRLALAERLREQEDTRAQRRTVLAKIEAELASEGDRLSAAEAEREELDVLLGEIEAALAQLIPEDSVEPFSEARGTLAWPVQGKLTERFGRPRNQGKMRWQGVRLQAAAGSSVTAIHHGRVVYADWLRGAGLLLVIDHGEGYMSLYAHNESLLRAVGDWVSAGAAVATVGASGGQTEPGLYFEIRKDGKPTDPQRWCRG